VRAVAGPLLAAPPVPSMLLVAMLLVALAGPASAQSLPLVQSAPAGGGATAYTVPVQTLLALTALGFLPSALMLMTSFTRFLIVFSLLRQALGLQTMPPNGVLVALSVFLTLFAMSPVIERIRADAWDPYRQGRLEFETAVERGTQPLREFMLRHTRSDDLDRFARMSGKPVQAREDVPLTVLVPAFAISEIRTGFLIGFMVFLPFLVVDLAVASILTSLGMVMVSPVMFSLPLKLVIFVMADGWGLLAGSLVASVQVR
jgi:flagellar biosynthetic protein FliP